MGARVSVCLTEAHPSREQAVVLRLECRMRFEETPSGRQDQASLAAIAIPAPLLDVVP